MDTSYQSVTPWHVIYSFFLKWLMFRSKKVDLLENDAYEGVINLLKIGELAGMLAISYVWWLYLFLVKSQHSDKGIYKVFIKIGIGFLLKYLYGV